MVSWRPIRKGTSSAVFSYQISALATRSYARLVIRPAAAAAPDADAGPRSPGRHRTRLAIGWARSDTLNRLARMVFCNWWEYLTERAPPLGHTSLRHIAGLGSAVAAESRCSTVVVAVALRRWSGGGRQGSQLTCGDFHHGP